MKTLLKRLWQEEDGQDLVEYGLLVALVALVAVTAMNSLAVAIGSTLGAATNALNKAANPT
jgi:pilus assembly protein Flp/PilA